MARGQAEALMPLLEQTLVIRGLDWSDLDAIAVGIGPGNFTGIRISVSAARGLALALGIPAIGVSMFEVMAYGNTSTDLLVSLPAPRDRAYLQPFSQGRATGQAVLVDPFAPQDGTEHVKGARVTGYLADMIAGQRTVLAEPTNLGNIPERIAHIAKRRLVDERETPDRPAPLYVRSADAAPPSDPPPVILP